MGILFLVNQCQVNTKIELKKSRNRFIKKLLLLQSKEENAMSLNSDWRDFLNESLDEKNIFTYIQGLQEIISNLKPRTMTEKRRLQLAKTHLREVKRFARRMENEAIVLKEKLNILEESKGDE